MKVNDKANRSGSRGQHQGNIGNTDIGFSKSSLYTTNRDDSHYVPRMGLFSEVHKKIEP